MIYTYLPISLPNKLTKKNFPKVLTLSNMSELREMGFINPLRWAHSKMKFIEYQVKIKKKKIYGNIVR